MFPFNINTAKYGDVLFPVSASVRFQGELNCKLPSRFIHSFIHFNVMFKVICARLDKVISVGPQTET